MSSDPNVARSAAWRVRSRGCLFICALLAGAQIESSYTASQAATLRSELMTIATATTEAVHERIGIGLPRIITWRPLPVAEPGQHRGMRPRATPKTTRRSS